MKRATAQAPGKVMLAGEYSVLQGGRALAITVNRRLRVVAEQSNTPANLTVLRSNLWPKATFLNLDQNLTADDEPLAHAVQRSCHRYKTHAQSVAVSSELDLNFGIGSSSALRLATIAAIARLAKIAPTPNTRWEWANEAFLLQRQAQARASGYDVATQLLGGLVLYEPSAPHAAQLGDGKRIVLRQDRWQKLFHLYVGKHGSATTGLVRSTWQAIDKGALWSELKNESERLIAAIIDILTANVMPPSSMPYLCTTIKNHRAVLENTPAFPVWMKGIRELPGCDETWSFKTTGAGGEDALLVVGPRSNIQDVDRFLAGFGWQPAPFGFVDEGLTVGLEEDCSD